MITPQPAPYAASTTSHPHPVTRPATGIQTTWWKLVSLFVGGCAQSRGRGRGGGGAGRLQASPKGGFPGKASSQLLPGFRVRVSGFGLQDRFGSTLQGLGFLFRELLGPEPPSWRSWC